MTMSQASDATSVDPADADPATPNQGPNQAAAQASNQAAGQAPGKAQASADAAADQPTDPWRVLRREQDRRRYLRILTPPRVGNDKPRRPNPAVGVERGAHHLLGSPSSMTRTATTFPSPDHVRQYLKHSADLTMRGGLAAAVVYPLAVCALAEHYVFRRIAGAGAGGAAAAAAAAAELGRGAPDPQPADPGLAVAPGFAGLAEVAGWLAGQDVAGAEQHRVARLFQPSVTTRPAYRAMFAVLRSSQAVRQGGRLRAGAVAWLAVLLAPLERRARIAVALLWLGALSACVGFSVALSRSPGLGPVILVAATLLLLATFGFVALAGSAAAWAISARQFVRDRAEAEHFGLVPGVEPAQLGAIRSRSRDQSGRSSQTLADRWDRLAGVPDPGDVPALVTWLADRLDDLAGVPRTTGDADDALGGTDRYALTFGDLWLGRIGPRTPADLALLRRACDDPPLRVIDLALVTTNLSQGRPYTLPFVTGERAEREGSARFLFCRRCSTAVLPLRVVAQLILMSPAAATEATCPRHPGETLHEVPEPWDFPVVAAVRMSMATPGLLSAVPLFTLDIEHPGPLQDEYGNPVADAPPSPGVFVPRTHWFSDGSISSDVPVHFFDTLLPRWPTFGLTLDQLGRPPVDVDGHRHAEWLTAPDQDAAQRPHRWRRLAGASGFLDALTASGFGWRDAMQADLPGFRGRVAVIRRSDAERGPGLLIPQPVILALAVRGYHAGLALRERFTGQDGDVPGQTQTDRYRWIRLRIALREYRELSLEIGARLPLYSDLAASYRVPSALTAWFTPPVAPGTTDPAWPDAAAAVTHLRALSAGGVLDWDTDYGAPPVDPDLRRGPLT